MADNPSNLTILRPVERDTGKLIPTRGQSSLSNRIRHAKLDLVNVLMRLDSLGVNVAGIDLNAVLEFGRKLNNL